VAAPLDHLPIRVDPEQIGSRLVAAVGHVARVDQHHGVGPGQRLVERVADVARPGERIHDVLPQRGGAVDRALVRVAGEPGRNGEANTTSSANGAMITSTSAPFHPSSQWRAMPATIPSSITARA
jgi:hypothetical protein